MRAATSSPPRRADAVRSREKLLVAAADVLSRDSGASIDAIATHAGVGRTTAFRHFPTRDALIGATWGHIVRQAEAELTGLRLDDSPPKEALDRLIEAIVALAGRWPLLFRGQRPAIDDPTLRATFARPEALVAATVRRAAAAKVLRDDLPTAVLSETLLGIAQAVLIAGLRGGDASEATKSLLIHGAGPKTHAVDGDGGLSRRDSSSSVAS